MQITELKLNNFRNYSGQIFAFCSTKNIIIGNNGEGKTNIVEAIYYLSITKSFRTMNDDIDIKEGEEFGSVEGTIKDKIINKYKVVLNKTGKKVFIDQNQIQRLSDFISKVNIVLFNPEDLKLIKDNPSTHRKLINMELSILNNNYLKALSSYNKILKQRNTYLKSMMINGMVPKDYLDILTNKLIDCGIQINELREKFINQINEYLNLNYQKITKKEGLTLKYVSDYANLSKEEILKRYNTMHKKDVNYGKTHFGIHLDDFIFFYNNHYAKDYLSEGEQKNAIVSFKLAEVSVFQKETGTMPILILDDLFSELDKEKITKILRFLKKGIQIFITTTDLEKVDERILKNSKIFMIKGNKIEEREYDEKVWCKWHPSTRGFRSS